MTHPLEDYKVEYQTATQTRDAKKVPTRACVGEAFRKVIAG